MKKNKPFFAINLLLIFCLIFLFSNTLLAQTQLRNPEVSYGQLIKTIPSLKDYKAPKGFKPNIGRIGDKVVGVDEDNEEMNHIQYTTKVARDPAVQNFANQENAANLFSTTLQNFAGLGYTNVAPADPSMCAGPNHIIQMINNSGGSLLKIWNRSGVQVLAQVNMASIVASSGYTGSGDPIAIYDQFANRFMLTEFARIGGSSINSLVVFVSQTADPTGGWYIYKFTDVSFFPDYPHYGVWPNVLYASTNDFNTAGTAYLGSSVWAMNKTKMIAGNATTDLQRIRLNFDCAPVNISGSTAPSNTGTIGNFMYYNDNDYNPSATAVDSIGMLNFSPDFVTPANTTLTFSQALVTAPYKSNVCASRNCVPSATAGSGYDAVGDRVMNRIMYRNFGSYETMVLNYTVDANAGTGNAAKSGIRWYELRKTGAAWSIFQQSTYAPDNDSRWMGSININSKGQIALGFNRSGSTSYASLCYTGRNIGDAPNTMSTAEIVAKAGLAYGTFGNRWGDYNDLPNDVVDDSLFWMTAMYGNTASAWATQIIQFKIGDCNVLNSSLSTNQSGTIAKPEGQNITYTNTLNNTGCVALTNYLLTDTLPTNVTFVSATAGGTYTAGNRVVSWPVNLTAGQSQNFSFTVSINNATYFATTTSINEAVAGTTIPVGWAATTGIGTSNWISSTTQSHSAPNALFGINNASANTDFRVSTTTQTALGTTPATLSFWHNYNTETDWDGGVVEMSINNGTTWTDLLPNISVNTYTSPVTASNPIAPRTAFNGNSRGWLQTKVRLLPVNQNALFRFRMTSDNAAAPAGGGWYVDDVLLQNIAEVNMRSNYFNAVGTRLSYRDTFTRILPPLYTGSVCSNGAATIISSASGTTYQWQINTGSGFVNMTDNVNYAGSSSNTLLVSNAPTSFYGYQYKCLVDGVTSSTTSVLKFVATWNGSVNSAWETAGNWSCNLVPDANTDVIINTVAAPIFVSSNAFCRSLQLNTGANVNVKPGFVFTVVH